MMNRVKRWLEEEDLPADYWIVCSEVGNIVVSREVAAEVGRSLEAPASPVWMAFQDLFGSEYRIRMDRIEAVWECTAEQRRKNRRFWNERRRESDSERRPWDDE